MEWSLRVESCYLIHHRPGHQIFEIGRHSIYRDLGGADQYLFFTEDYYGVFGQEFKLDDKHTTKIYGKFTSYRAFLDRKAKNWSGYLHYKIDMGRRNDLIIDYMLSREFLRGSSEFMVSEGGLTHSRKYLFDNYTLDSSFKLRYSDFRKLIATRG